jgi:hypothetical protein
MIALFLTRSMAALMLVLVLWQSSAFQKIDSAAAVVAASGISRQVSTQEWLGPLSAIALSPFFGLACLSGAATYGPEWLQSRSALLSPSSPLNNPLLFWLMLGLTVATSAPRLTKLSKPFALALEKLEMYSAVIILISMKFLASPVTPTESGIAIAEDVMMTAGISTLPIDMLLSIAAALNILVVNTIKLAIEILVWLIPFPTVDAMLEIANKSLCASLMALYAYSPLLATVLNLAIAGVCALVFFRVQRRMAYMKELVIKPLLYRLLGWSMDNCSTIGFLAQPWSGLPIRSAIRMTPIEFDGNVRLEHRGWFRVQTFVGKMNPECKSGVVCDQIVIRVDGVDLILDVRKGFALARTSLVAV